MRSRPGWSSRSATRSARARRWPCASRSRRPVRAAVLTQPGPGALPELRDDVSVVGPGPGEVRLAVRATGVCHSDLSVLSGVIRSAPPVIPGHEGAGEVLETGAGVTGIEPGQ